MFECQREVLQVEDNRGQLYQRATIDVLPDDVLLDVFTFYLDQDHYVWHKLVHVCRRWRQVVFASPRRLNLRLLCTNRTPVEKLLDIWPALPMVIRGHRGESMQECVTNIESALEHNDRVCKITFQVVPSPFLTRFTLIKEPFPALTSLLLRTYGHRAPVIPDSFLGGSTPRLRKLTLIGIPFPGLPKLLLSAHHLVYLLLCRIPDSGFISPEAMVSGLSSLTNLKKLLLEFRSPQSRPRPSQARPPLTCIVLPSLTSLSFKGVSEYLEDILARIDIPLLNRLHIRFFNHPISDTPLLRSFISRTEAFKALRQAKIQLSFHRVDVILVREGQAHDRALQLGLLFETSDRRLSSIARVFNSSLPLFPTLEHIEIYENLYGRQWQDDAQWLDLFHPFIAVKSLYLYKNAASRVALALQEVSGERVTEVLPVLQNLFVQGPVQQGIAQFIATRQLLGHPVAVHDWDSCLPSGAWKVDYL